MVKRPDSPTCRGAVLPILTGSKACCKKAFSFPVSRDHGPHAAGLEAQQPGDDEAARGYLGEKHSERYQLRAAVSVPDREDGGQLHRKPL